MHYQDRILLEKSQTSLPRPLPPAPFEMPKTHLDDVVLRLRNRKSHHVYVSTGPSSNKDILSGSRPVRFDEDGRLLLPNDRSDRLPAREDLKEEEEEEEGGDSDSDSSDDIPTGRGAGGAAPSEAVTGTSAGPVVGRRVGFGAIASLPPRAAVPQTAPPCITCAEDVTGPAERDVKKNPRAPPEEGEGEGRIITETGCYDDLSDDGEDEACVSASELEAAALEAERVRQKNIMAALMQLGQTPRGPDGEALTDVPMDRLTTTTIDPAAEGPSQPTAPTGRVGDLRLTSAAAWGAPRFDPLAGSLGALALTEEELALRRAKAKEEVHAVRRKTEASKESASAWARHERGEGTAAGEETKEQRFADLDKLKGIFYREVGGALVNI